MTFDESPLERTMSIDAQGIDEPATGRLSPADQAAIDALGADFVPLYRTRELTPQQAPAGDLVVLASASAARAFGRLGSDIPAISIGPLTTQAARDAGVEIGRAHV